MHLKRGFLSARCLSHAKEKNREQRHLAHSRSQAKIYENFNNFFLKTKANNKCFIVLKCTCKGLQKSISELER